MAQTESNKEIIRRYIEQIWNRGNLAAADEFLAPNYIRHIAAAPAPLDRDQQKQRLAGFRAAFPDVHLTIDDLFAEGDRVALRVTIRGTQRGKFQNIEPTGKSVSVAALDIVRFENGKMIEHWGGPDLFALLQQLQSS